jgi:hypothetical protein
MGGATLDFWDRHLNGGGHGEDEYWFPITLKGGVDLTPRMLGWVGSAGLKVPVFTYEKSHAERYGEGTVSLYPQAMVSAYGELGYQFTRHFSARAFFDSYWFRQSPTVQQGPFLITQPESQTYEVGAKLDWTF